MRFCDNDIFVGILITNLVARDASRRASALKTLHANFDELISISVPENVNEIVVGLPMSQRHADILVDGTFRRDENIQCNVATCQVSEKIQSRIAALVENTRTYLSADVDATALQSTLTELLSKVYCYQ